MDSLPLKSSGLRIEREMLPAPLRPYVREIYEEAFPAPAETVRFPISANTTPCLHVRLVGELWVEIGGSFWIPPVIVAGCQPEGYFVTVREAFQGFYVVFEAVGPLVLLGMRHFWRGETAPPHFAETVRPSLAADARAYSEAVVGTPDFASRATLTEAFLRDALAGAPAADLAEAAFLQEALDEIERTAGGVRVDGLAMTLGVSPSTLRRRFRTLGMPAKRIAEIVRFRQAHVFLHQAPGATFAGAALEFGYADQPHFSRDYHRFSGTPPSQWLHNARVVDRRLGIEGRFDPESDAA